VPAAVGLDSGLRPQESRMMRQVPYPHFFVAWRMHSGMLKVAILLGFVWRERFRAGF
jgi:hypothetical protein